MPENPAGIFELLYHAAPEKKSQNPWNPAAKKYVLIKKVVFIKQYLYFWTVFLHNGNRRKICGAAA